MSRSTAKYTALPTAPEEEGLLAAASPLGSDDDESDTDTAVEASPGERPPSTSTSFPPPVDARFIQPTPSPWKRAGLLLAIAFLFWLTFQLKGRPGAAKAKVVHATRYSKEFKYRPAASPIITETLKDGRLRVRGAGPTSSATPVPVPTTKPKGTKKRSGKKRSGKGKKARKA
ncbi:hypothetical protein DFH09DRAFT_992106 [Mycena vulgaris]|nr:hypothetical protein DFH09DRAFT_992106 [Mycena vulgaris]